MSDSIDVEEDAVVNRLIRIETRIVKMMEALGIDPRTGERVVPAKQKRRTFNNDQRKHHD